MRNAVKLLSATVVTLFFVGIVNAQTIEIPSGGSINTAFQNAESGAVIILEDGGTYTVDSTVVFDKRITLKSEENAAVRPEVTMAGGEFRFTGSGGGIIMQGININSDGVNYLVTMAPEFSAASIIKTVDCKITNFNRSSFREDGPQTGTIDSVIVRNCEYNNFDGGGYRFVHFGSIISFDYMEFSNSTVANFTESFIWSETPSTKEIVIDHCTIVGLADPKPAFLGLTSAGGSITISNTIMAYFERNNDNSVFDMAGFTTSSISNSRYYDVGDPSFSWSSETDFVEYEPDFADTANYDFTLPENSQLLTAGTDGGIIGDPRWDPTVTGLEDETPVPNNFGLNQNYPNPFNPTTVIEYTLEKSAYIQINVYNVRGEQMTSLVNTTKSSGTHQVRFNANALPAGLYYYELKSGDISDVKKMVLLK